MVIQWHLERGDMREVLAALPDHCIDAIVTDPPYELGFMGKKWDRSGVAFDPATWAAALRVLKPGGHMVAFGGTRGFHRIACAIEDAGFEIRDCLSWMYGSGFPKSLNVSKAIDEAAGAERTKTPTTDMVCGSEVGAISPNKRCAVCNLPRVSANPCRCPRDSGPATEAAARWDGWGTALKPAWEPIILARKPLVGTVAANVLEYGTGGLNVDATRIGRPEGDRTEYGRDNTLDHHGSVAMGKFAEVTPYAPDALGRWPANVVLDEEAAALLDEASGNRPGMSGGGKHKADYPGGMFGGIDSTATARGDSGGASRFFYCAKTSAKEREAGLEHLPKHTAGDLTDREDGSDGLNSPRAGAGRTAKGRANVHPTVKPIALMRWLVRLVTPPGGLVLDPFTGSGSTGCAAVMEGMGFLGVDLSEEYLAIAAGRIAHWSR